MPGPYTRDQAITLLQKLAWDDDELGPEERQAIRDLYHLDDTGRSLNPASYLKNTGYNMAKKNGNICQIQRNNCQLRQSKRTFEPE